MNPNFLILYVSDLDSSTVFYTELLGQPPVETSPNFVGFALESGIFLGLWAKSAVEPVSVMTGGGTEIGFSAANKEVLDKIYVDWVARHVPIAQVPIQMDFGYTFVGLDPDGHRLRIMVNP